MALINCNYYSRTLAMSVSANVILPEFVKGNENVKTVYLLHGLADDHTTWQRRTSIEKYAAEKGIAVIMPNVARSFYTDMDCGYNYFTFLTQELLEKMCTMFRISDKREDNFVIGLSMGGYGALKVGLSRPDYFSAAASLSGALEADRLFDEPRFFHKEYSNVFGNQVKGTKNDLYYLAENIVGEKPRIFVCCGTEDALYSHSQNIKCFMEKTDFDFTYQEEPGNHEWGYWDRKLHDALNWIFEKQ